MPIVKRRKKCENDTVKKNQSISNVLTSDMKISKSSAYLGSNLILYFIILGLTYWVFLLHQKLSKYQRKIDLSLEKNEVNKLEERASNFDWVVDPRTTPSAIKSFDDSSVKNLLLNWTKHLNELTPDTWQNKKSKINCRYDAIIPKSDLSLSSWHNGKALNKASNILKECGFVYLDDLFRKEFVDELKDFYRNFVSEKNKKANSKFKYPCQGEGRIEYMMPFVPPYNESNTSPYGDQRIRDIVSKFLGPPYKLELMTVINSLPGSRHQRWHQGWRYLFHETEHLPPYAIVVTVPLDDVTVEMGGTQFCPRKKLRFYHGWRCDDPVQAATTKGTVVMFDYKTLHRGPANLSDRDRPMISMVFSKSWFLNSEAFVNRGISLIQSLHQRRYMEQWYWHPDKKQDFFKV